MSWQAMAWADALPADVVGATGFRVLLKLANVADAHGRRAFRSKKEMAEELGVSQQTIRRAIRDLETVGLIGRGDQAFVKHIAPNRRPVVYDLGLNPTAPEIFDFDEPAVEGDLGGTSGGTSGDQSYPQGVQKTRLGATTVDQHKNDRTNRYKDTNVTTDRTRANSCRWGHPIVGVTGSGIPICREGDYPSELALAIAAGAPK